MKKNNKKAKQKMQVASEDKVTKVNFSAVKSCNKVIKGLTSGELEIIAVSLNPEDMKKMLLCNSKAVQKEILDDFFSCEPELIESLSEYALEKIGDSILPHEMSAMLLKAPFDLRKKNHRRLLTRRNQ